MKIRLFMTMAAATLILAGCSNDENGMIDSEPVELRLTSGVEVQQTRAAFTPTQDISIRADEVVSIWVNDAITSEWKYRANPFKADGSNGFTIDHHNGGEHMYFPQTGNKINIYAIHGKFTTPFSKGAEFPTSAVEYSVEADQSVASGIGYQYSDLLYAYEKDVARSGNPTTKQLTFYHMLSKLELAIQIGNGGPALATTGAVTLENVTLNGKFMPSTSATMGNQSERADMLSAVDQSTTDDMTLGQQTCDDFSESNVVYNEAILVPQDMMSKRLTFELADGGTLTYTIPEFSHGAAVFESGKKYRYHITLNLTGLTVTSEITDWEAVSPVVEGEAKMPIE